MQSERNQPVEALLEAHCDAWCPGCQCSLGHGGGAGGGLRLPAAPVAGDSAVGGFCEGLFRSINEKLMRIISLETDRRALGRAGVLVGGLRSFGGDRPLPDQPHWLVPLPQQVLLEQR